MADRWKLGSYTFTINPNRYGEQYNVIGDNAMTLDGTIISQPTSIREDYAISSIFFQNRPRVISQITMPNLSGMKYVNGKYYVLNNSTKKVDVYGSNFALQKSITVVTSPNGEQLVAFDVKSDETLYVLESNAPCFMYKVVGATITKTALTSYTGECRGVKCDGTNLWVVTSTPTLYQLKESDYSVLKSVNLPFISASQLGYKGIEIVNGYIVLSYVNDDISGAMHIDKTTGFIVNSFTLPDYTQIVDVTHDGTNYIFSTYTTNQIIYTNGNTLMLDLYNLERQIKLNGYLDMIDDMGSKKRVAVSSYNIERLDGSLVKYSVDIQATKVNRGVNQ